MIHLGGRGRYMLACGLLGIWLIPSLCSKLGLNAQGPGGFIIAMVLATGLWYYLKSWRMV
tara:strand:+ start:2181 stop:2360 length:180 start_codon:yes stop_codon:yes gene_type:complete